MHFVCDFHVSQTEQALIVDSIAFAVRSLQELFVSSRLNPLPPLNCEAPQLWKSGDLVISKMLRVKDIPSIGAKLKFVNYSFFFNLFYRVHFVESQE